MSALLGCGETSYYAIAPIRRDLNLGGAGNKELEFYSGFSEDPMSQKPMRPWSVMTDWILFNQITPTPFAATNAVKKALADQQAKEPANSTSNNKSDSIYAVIQKDARLSKFKDLIDYVGYGKVYEEGVTIFAPLNDQFDKVLEYPLKIAYKPVAALQTLRYHILPFVIKPWQMQERRMNLKTDLEKQILEVDWTHGKQLIMNKIDPPYLPDPIGTNNNGPGDSYPVRPDTWFPSVRDECPILESYQCANGMLYIIQRPVVPADLL